MKEIITLLKEWLENEHFEPFKIVLTNGQEYPVKNPRLVVPMQSVIFYAYGRDNKHAYIQAREVTAIETLERVA